MADIPVADIPVADIPVADSPAVGPVLRVRGLRAGHAADRPIVHDLSFDVGANQIVALLGPNGAGKSTALQAIAGAAPVLGGQVLCGGADLAGCPSWRIARAGIGFVPQRDNVFAGMTVQENLDLGRTACAGRRGPSPIEVLRLFPELAGLRGTRVGTLSGGQRQMVAIGRALLGGPVVLLLDEPTAGLAANVVKRLLESLSGLKRHLPVVLVEQNVRAALAVADRAVLMAEGRLRRDCAADALLADPALALGDFAAPPAAPDLAVPA